jgi:hypothetical protein
VLLISFAFCVVFLVGSVTPCCPSSVFGEISDSVFLIFLVFCVVFLVGPWLRVSHLFCFQGCVYGGVRDVVLLIFLVFCVVFLVRSVTPCCSSL